MTAAACQATLSGDHDWPSELDGDAECRRCGVWYAEYCDRLGDLFTEKRTRRPTAADEQLRGEALASVKAALDLTPDTAPAHRTLCQIGREIAGLRGAELVVWADLVRVQHQQKVVS